MENEIIQHEMESFVAGNSPAPGNYPNLKSNVVSPMILIVDDDPMVLRLVTNMLKSLGYNPVIASDALHALECLNQYHYDLVISDYEMPFVSGCQLADAIYSRYPKTRVILMSGYEKVEILKKIKVPSAIDGFLHKPFTLAEMKEKIKSALSDSRSSRLIG
jgi:DNA-binding NtrC family response regulator